MRRTLYIAAIGLSAFLLFTLELFAGKLALPVFGGTPSVWTTALCFFTGVVFIGYLYAHLLTRWLRPTAAAGVHVAVVVLAAAATLMAPRDVAAVAPEGVAEVFAVLWLLALIAGPAAFVLSTTTPLLSAWFARFEGDPWWLYAVSNAASLGGLVAYPLLIEPLVPLSVQFVRLQVLLVVVVALVAAVAFGLTRREPLTAPAAEAPEANGDDGTATPAAPTAGTYAIWLFAAAVPAGLLSATTTHITTDHVSAPLLWIGPLGIYLASFVVAFSERGRRLVPYAEELVPAAATLMWVPYLARVSWPAGVLVPLLLCCFAVLAVAIHGRLSLARPSTEHLTAFYLVLSAGGVVATTFVALVAPLVFSDVYEYPLLLVAALVALALFSPAPLPRVPGEALRLAGVRLVPYAMVGTLLVWTVTRESTLSGTFVGVVLAVGAMVIFSARSYRALAIASAVAIVALSLLFIPPSLARVRTFFGITQVRAERDGLVVSEIHGTTLHGVQFTDERRPEPTAYFVRSGPLGDVFDDLARRTPQGASIGVVGLGIGTVASYARASDQITYFEVDPAVVDLAVDGRYFSYLADAAVQPSIVLGDGRLSLAREPAGTYDLVVLDAFSSDAVPAHLLTREAMASYERLLRPGGLIVFQLTNRHFDLVPGVAATARARGLDARTRSYMPRPAERERLDAQPSTWLVVGPASDVARFDSAGWTRPESGPVLTDDFSDVLRLLRWW